MEPATLEMSEFSNTSAAFVATLVIGAIGFMSYSLAKAFKDFTRIRAESHEILETDISADSDLPNTLDLSTDLPNADDVLPEAEDVLPNAEEDEADDDVLPEAEDVLHNAEGGEEDEEEDDVVDMSIDDDSEEAEGPVDPYLVLRLDIDSLQERIDNISAELQEHRVASSKNTQSMFDLHDTHVRQLSTLCDKNASLIESSIKQFVETLNTEILKFNTALLTMNEKMSALETNLSFAKVSIEQCKYEYSKVPTESEVSRMISAALDAKTSPADLVKTVDLDKVDKRTQIQKTVYQAWNGNAKWVGTSDFPEGSLFIQMIRKRFMTKEQNDDWLSADNKKIATYNRDSLLGLSDENWSTHDHKVHTKRYYKDDWDTALDISITITYSKEEPTLSKNKNSTILRFLHSNGKIEWDNLLVNV
jgi:hypothetical protein